jgi:hypothetical protein
MFTMDTVGVPHIPAALSKAAPGCIDAVDWDADDIDEVSIEPRATQIRPRSRLRGIEAPKGGGVA